MAEEVFINSQGQEVYMPQSAGKGLGLRKASEFVPKEAKKDAGKSKDEKPLSEADQLQNAITTVETITSRGASTDAVNQALLSKLGVMLTNYGFGVTTKPSTPETDQAEREHAMTLLYGVATNGPDELSAETADGLHRLTERLLDNGFGPQPIEAQDEQTGGPSLVDAIVTIEKQIDADDKKTPAQKKKLKEHLQELLDNAEPGDTPPAA